MDNQNDTIQRIIQRRLKGGALPSEAPSQVLNGTSTGCFCAACCRYLSDGADEIQAVDANGASTYFHPLCFGLTARARESLAGEETHASAFQLLRLLIGARPQEKRKAA